MCIDTWKMIHIGFGNHFVHRYLFVKVTKPILRSGDFNTCLICYIEKKREWIIKKKRRCMYQMTTITDYIAHSIISPNKKKRKRRFVYFFSMSDTTTNYDCIVTIVHRRRTHSLTPPPPPSSCKHWISRARALYRALALNEKKHIEIVYL